MSGIEIILTVGSNEKMVHALGPNGEQKDGAFVLDDLRRDTIEVFQRWLYEGKIGAEKELEVLGRHLFDALFNGDVRSYFEEKLKKDSLESPLRLQLSFEKGVSESVRGYLWEYLYYAPQGAQKFFLSLGTNLVLSRYLPPPGGRGGTLQPEKGPLKILVVVAQPGGTGLEPLDDSVLREITSLQTKTSVEIQHCDKATFDSLNEMLREYKPHLLHLIAYGRLVGEPGSKVAEIALLEPDETNAKWMRASEFNDIFTRNRAIPRLAFLTLCQGVSPGLQSALADMVSQQLILDEVQTVVAVQHSITNKAASAFACEFYRELAKNNPVDYAVQMARWKTKMKRPQGPENDYYTQVFGTHILYLCSQDGRLLPPPKEHGKEDDPKGRRGTGFQSGSGSAAGAQGQQRAAETGAQNLAGSEGGTADVSDVTHSSPASGQQSTVATLPEEAAEQHGSGSTAGAQGQQCAAETGAQNLAGSEGGTADVSDVTHSSPASGQQSTVATLLDEVVRPSGGDPVRAVSEILQKMASAQTRQRQVQFAQAAPLLRKLRQATTFDELRAILEQGIIDAEDKQLEEIFQEMYDELLRWIPGGAS